MFQKVKYNIFIFQVLMLENFKVDTCWQIFLFFKTFSFIISVKVLLLFVAYSLSFFVLVIQTRAYLW